MVGRQIHKTKGFTIIEVMIVLSIAALIMLIVFWAVPALQRSYRNTARKQDLGRLSAAILQFLSETSNRPPGYVNGAWDNSLAQATKDTNRLLAITGPLSGYKDAIVNSPITTSGNPNGPDGISMVTGNTNLPNALAANVGMELQIVVRGLCLDDGSATSTGASPIDIAIQYTLETSDPDRSLVFCKQAQ